MTVLELDIRATLGGFTLNASGAVTERVTGLIGRSGCGKTSLLHAICGLVRPDAGRITLGERVLFDSDKRINVPVHRRNIGVMFQDSRVFPHRSVDSNLRYARRRTSSAAPSFDDVVGLLQLEPLLNRRPRNLSGGEQRRVALGRTLLSNPELLLLDEPLTGLDHRLKSQIMPLLRRVRDELNIPILYVSHQMTDVLQMTSHAALMDDGVIIAIGPLRMLAQQTDSFETVHDLGFTNVLRCTAREVDHASDTTVVDIDAPAGSISRTRVRLAGRIAAVGEPVRLAVRPQDIALSSAPLQQVSIQNQLPGAITAVSDHQGKVMVEIDLGQRVLVEITRRARDDLQLAVGGEVCCLIKSTAIDVLP